MGVVFAQGNRYILAIMTLRHTTLKLQKKPTGGTQLQLQEEAHKD